MSGVGVGDALHLAEDAVPIHGRRWNTAPVGGRGGGRRTSSGVGEEGETVGRVEGVGSKGNGRCGTPLKGMRGAEHHSEEAKIYYLTIYFYIRALFECIFLH